MTLIGFNKFCSNKSWGRNVTNLSPLERDLYLRAERLCTVERMHWTEEQCERSPPSQHIDQLYEELRLEVGNGKTVEEAHAAVRQAIANRRKRKSDRV